MLHLGRPRVLPTKISLGWNAYQEKTLQLNINLCNLWPQFFKTLGIGIIVIFKARSMPKVERLKFAPVGQALVSLTNIRLG